MPLSSSERRENAIRAARTRWERVTDRRLELAPARMGFLKRFMWQVDPEWRLPHEERVRLAKEARADYMRTLRSRRA